MNIAARHFVRTCRPNLVHRRRSYTVYTVYCSLTRLQYTVHYIVFTLYPEVPQPRQYIIQFVRTSNSQQYGRLFSLVKVSAICFGRQTLSSRQAIQVQLFSPTGSLPVPLSQVLLVRHSSKRAGLHYRISLKSRMNACNMAERYCLE